MTARDISLALLVALLWGTNFVVMKHAVSEVPPLLLTAVRFTLAAVPAVFFIARPNVAWRILIGYGLAFGFAKFGLVFTAFKLGGAAGLISVLLQAQVFFTILLAQMLMGETVSASQRLGIGVALAGIASIILGGFSDAAFLPILLIVAAALAWSVANVIMKRAGSVDMLAFTVWTSLMTPLPMLALSAVVEGVPAWHDAWAHLTWLGAAAVLYIAYPISILTGALWGYLLSRYPAATVTPFALLVPIFGILSGTVVYGERLTMPNAIGSALILAGLIIIVLAGRYSKHPFTNFAKARARWEI